VLLATAQLRACLLECMRLTKASSTAAAAMRRLHHPLHYLHKPGNNMDYSALHAV
jgi:hypothetical protein